MNLNDTVERRSEVVLASLDTAPYRRTVAVEGHEAGHSVAVAHATGEGLSAEVRTYFNGFLVASDIILGYATGPKLADSWRRMGCSL
jgi:hypothetical protein